LSTLVPNLIRDLPPALTLNLTSYLIVDLMVYLNINLTPGLILDSISGLTGDL
jgi:hypothetical protein